MEWTVGYWTAAYLGGIAAAAVETLEPDGVESC